MTAKAAPEAKEEAKKEVKEAKAAKEAKETTAKPKETKKAPKEVAKPKEEAKKEATEKKSKPDVERFYTFNLRDAYTKPRKKRAKAAVKILRNLIARHLKAANVKISNALNAALWKHSADKPPRKVKVKVSKSGDTAEAEPA